jgi:flagellum-specific peptidoglycan hydrolase FlgJ
LKRKIIPHDMNRYHYHVTLIRSYAHAWLRRYWLRLFLSALVIHAALTKEISFEFSMQAPRPAGEEQAEAYFAPAAARERLDYLETPPTTEQAPRPAAKKKDARRANQFSNVKFLIDPQYAERHGVDLAIVAEKLAICEAYVDQYATAAVADMKKHGIPASVKLAQALLESDAGGSRLARESNNHFGIKCRSKCRGCTCRNYTDDDIYDMFRVFPSPEDSFHEHSQLLMGARYRHLLELDRRDYEGWAFGLKKAGYATDRLYAEKLLSIIEALALHRFDRR